MSNYSPAPVDGSYDPSTYLASDPRHWPGLLSNREALEASQRYTPEGNRQDQFDSNPAYMKKGFAASAHTARNYLLYIFLLLTLWIWALVVTIIYWKEISLWAKIIAVVGLVFNVSISIGTDVHYIFKTGSILTLLVVYISRGLNKQ